MLSNRRLSRGLCTQPAWPSESYNQFKALTVRPGCSPAARHGRRAGAELAETTNTVTGVAERYATALFDLALESDALAPVGAELQRFETLMGESADLARLVRSPVYSAEEQLRAVTAILDKAGITGPAANLIKVAARNRRLFAVPDMIRSYRQLHARQRGEVSAEVTSAEPLGDVHVTALKEALKASIGKDVDLATRVDPALLGGLIVKVGSRMIDTSLRTKLNSLKIAMKEVG